MAPCLNFNMYRVTCSFVLQIQWASDIIYIAKCIYLRLLYHLLVAYTKLISVIQKLAAMPSFVKGSVNKKYAN